MSEPTHVNINAKTARYIKFGAGGVWEAICLKEGTLRLGFYEVSHEAGLSGDKEAIKKAFTSITKEGSGSAANYARQVMAFYDLSPEVLWFTFADGYLWWCQASPEVEYLGSSPVIYPHGSRLRRTVNGWSNRSIKGKPLRILDLNGELSKTGAYRGTICDLKPHLLAYLLRKINDEALPELIDAQEGMADLLHAVRSMIPMLHWRDFELLVELIFSHSGWQRVSVVGDGLKTTDIELVLPITGERAMVQVKSQTTQAQLDEYIAAFRRWEIERLFYVYHTVAEPFSLDVENARVTLIGPEKLCSMVLRAGLVDWLMQKVG